jgi:hypothetical protein
MATNYAEKKQDQTQALIAALEHIQSEGVRMKLSLYYFQDRLDHYTDAISRRYERLGQVYDFTTDPNVQHFEFMIASHNEGIDRLRERYVNCKRLLDDNPQSDGYLTIPGTNFKDRQSGYWSKD